MGNGRRTLLLVALGAALLAPISSGQAPAPLGLPEENHLRNVRQLTFGGENAEAYFSADNRRLSLQAHEGPDTCDQIYVMDLQGGRKRRVSPGTGKTTCAYYFPNGKRLLFSSTHLVSAACPPRPDYSRGYVWPVYADYDIFTARPDGRDLRRLTATPGYDAEATISRDGRKIVFTSTRDGDLDIYVMENDGKNVRRLTHELGYDGGPFFSPDGTKIVYRAHHPTEPADVGDYKTLLAQGLLRPTRLEIWVMDADGSNKRRVTRNGAANFAPFWHPDGKRIIFSSNMAEPGSRPDSHSRRGAGAGNFDLYLINLDGTGLERVTYSPEFDGFPMFSSDGKKLVWASNRNQRQRGETNIFLSDWAE